MNPLRIEEVILHSRLVVEGQLAASEVAPLVEYILVTTTKQAERISMEGDNPERSDELVAALHAYVSHLTSLHGAMSAGDFGTISDSLARVENALATLRHVQISRQQQTATGPTVFLYVNRVLLQADAISQGLAPAKYLTDLLSQRADFIRSVKRDLRAAPTQIAYRSVLELERQLAALQDADIAAARPGIIDAAGQVAGLVAQYGADGREEGPTPMPAVNLVLRSVEELRHGDISAETFGDTVKACRDEVRARWSPILPSASLANLCELLSSIDAIEDAAPTADLDGAVSRLTDAAWGFEQQGLPPILQEALDTGEAFVAGRVEAEAVHEAADRLDGLIDGTETQISEAGGGHSAMQTMDTMREIAGALRTLADHGDARALEAARALAAEAATLLA